MNKDNVSEHGRLALKKVLFVLLSVMCCVVLLTQNSYSLTVTNTNDSGAGSLRQAITDSVSGDTIVFDSSLSSQIIYLNSQLYISGKAITIDGLGADTLALDGNDSVSIFTITQNSTVTIRNLTMQNGNGGYGKGGGIGIYVNSVLTLENCAILNCRTTNDWGGGIYVSGTLNAFNCLISGNTAKDGGGVFGDQYSASSINLSNCTITGNSAEKGGGVDGNTNVSISNCTITGNSATAYGGGGILLWGSSGNSLINSIVYGNSATNSNKDIQGSITTSQYNIVGTGGVPDGVNGNMVGIDPLFDSLADNGGPTQTHALLTGSPAIDYAPTGLAVDQRGVSRPQGSAYDIGAYEFVVQETIIPQILGYIPLTNSNEVSLVDFDDNSVIQTIPVGTFPRCVAANPKMNRVYVSNANSGDVSVIDTITNTVIDTISISGIPLHLAVNPNGNQLYIVTQSPSYVLVVDTSNNSVITTISAGSYPIGVCTDYAGENVYVGDRNTNRVYVINAITNSIKTSFTVPFSLLAFETSADDSRLYIASDSAGIVAVVDTMNYSTLHTISVCNTPISLVAHPTKNLLYVINRDDDNVLVINTLSNMVITTIPVGDAPHGISINNNGSRIYVTNNNDDSVSVIDTETNSVINSFWVGDGPESIGNFIIDNKPLPTIDFNPTDLNVHRNQGVEITVNISDASDIVGYRIALDLDPSKVTYVPGSATKVGTSTENGWGPLVVNSSSPEIAIFTCASATDALASGAGSLMKFQLHVNETLADFTPISVSFTPLTSLNEDAIAFSTEIWSATVLGPNHQPYFIGGANQVVLEDSGAHEIIGWATDISPGIAYESWQDLNFTLDIDNASLFFVQPTIDASGALRYTLASDEYGICNATAVLHDSGGTANGGIDSSTPYIFSITADPVNDAPSFIAGATAVVLNATGGQHTFPGWATSISVGPANESDQSVWFFYVETSNPELFSASPTIDAGGTLRFTPNLNTHGVFDATATLFDSGGIANGGINHSPAQQFVIKIYIPFMWGDLNDNAQAGSVDASLLLQFNAELIDSFPGYPVLDYPEYYPDPMQPWLNFPIAADVNDDDVAGTLDASLVLQKYALLIDCFPADLNCDQWGPDEPLPAGKVSKRQTARNMNVLFEQQDSSWIVTFQIDNADDVQGLRIDLSYNPEQLQFNGAASGWLVPSGLLAVNDSEPGRLILSGALGTPLQQGQSNLMSVKFDLAGAQTEPLLIQVDEEQTLVNDGQIRINLNYPE